MTLEMHKAMRGDPAEHPGGRLTHTGFLHAPPQPNSGCVQSTGGTSRRREGSRRVWPGHVFTQLRPAGWPVASFPPTGHALVRPDSPASLTPLLAFRAQGQAGFPLLPKRGFITHSQFPGLCLCMLGSPFSKLSLGTPVRACHLFPSQILGLNPN